MTEEEKKDLKVGDLVEVRILPDHPELGIIVDLDKQSDREHMGVYVLIEGWIANSGMVKAWVTLKNITKIETDIK